MSVRRIFVEKKPGFDVKAQKLREEITEYLEVSGISNVRVLDRYDLEGVPDEDYEKVKYFIFSDPPANFIYEDELPVKSGERVFAVELLPGQYEQRADSCAQSIQLITEGERPAVKVATVIIIDGNITDEAFERIKNYYINPVESRLAGLEKPETLREEYRIPEKVEVMEGFISLDDEALKKFAEKLGFAMSFEDLAFCRDYFRDTEKRNPTVTELRMIDTYWSDHCRHTTFMTEIEEVSFDSGPVSEKISDVYNMYLETRKNVYNDREKPVCLMDIATIAMKELKRLGRLDDLDESDEVNACSIVVDIDVDGKKEPYLVMFKNETHNHPTEIEPFGGASTCLGGAIRDPLSGRSYVYQAMRITGCGDPRKPFDQTLPGKLPQRVITTQAALGYSSYGNQIGVTTGQVQEIYHEGYVAKRMELGAIVAAAPKRNVVREKPKAGDVILLIGGRTGRDGLGGATGSSKEHTEESLTESGAEVQKGNPAIERNILRLFRKPEASVLIKKCNDFGAGGVSVAIGELADGLEIDLDAVPTKYPGLDGTEIAISESQERMAVVVSADNADKFIKLAKEENLEATIVAKVTDSNRLVMNWRGQRIVDISREFLNTSGVRQKIKVAVKEPEASVNIISSSETGMDFAEAFRQNLQKLNVCSQKGLVEMFDSTVGAGTVLMPLGGKNQLTPAEGMAAKIPVQDGETSTATLMAFGFNPEISTKSPFHGAVYAVVESVAKIVAMGGDHTGIRLSLQEYFEKLGKDPVKWGKPFSALMGAFYSQMNLKIPAIGGKDSMSGTFNDLNVPPTLVSFAICTADAAKVLSPEFKKAGSSVALVKIRKDRVDLPDFEHLNLTYSKIHRLISERKILSACTVKSGGVAEAVSKMAFGNDIGFVSSKDANSEYWFAPCYGNIVLEISETIDAKELLAGLDYEIIGKTTAEPVITIGGAAMDLNELKTLWQEPLESVFPTRAKHRNEKPASSIFNRMKPIHHSEVFAKPRVFIPALPGTSCEYDIAAAFEKAGAAVDVFVLKNSMPAAVKESVRVMREKIQNSQIVMIPGGFSASDKSDGSGRITAAVFGKPELGEALMDLVRNRDGLILGISGGFYALLKLGLLPYGEIREQDENSPTLALNVTGKYVSRLVRTKVVSSLSPWLAKTVPGDVYTVAVSHIDGRFTASEETYRKLMENGQIATQYVDFNGSPTYDIEFNPNGSLHAVEGITSPDGRIFGKMGHSERYSAYVFRNVPGEMDQKLFESGVEYFK